MEGVQCPFCGQVIWSAYWSNPGEERCIYCGKTFVVREENGKLVAYPLN